MEPPSPQHQMLSGELHFFKLTSSNEAPGLPTFESISVRRLNAYTDVVDTSSTLEHLHRYISNPNYMVILCDPGHLVQAHKFIALKHLRVLSDLHAIPARNETRLKITQKLQIHTCSTCLPVYTVLKFRTQGRFGVEARHVEGNISMGPLVATMPCQLEDGIVDPLASVFTHDRNCNDGSTAHLTPPSLPRIRAIIKEWREAMSPPLIGQSPCSICSRLFRRADLCEVDARSIDLTLLRNEDVPLALMPKDYDADAYSGALLCKEGLRTLLSPGPMDVCSQCHRDVNRGCLPKFALANHLYYAKQCLPPDISHAFEDSTCFERGLIARARTNSICCRIPIPDEPLADEARTSSFFFRVKKGVRGNVIVAPLDSMRLFQTIPPPLDETRDIFCAVLVSSKIPDRKTIESLHPILARRSRVEAMLNFLLKHNPQYKAVDGFKGISRENLNALFDKSSANGLPPSVQIGVLPTDPALEAAKAGFTTCNLATSDGRDVEGVLMENIGFTISDNTPMDYRQMKMQALLRCLNGKPFVLSSSGNRIVSDFNNPYLLSWLFPHLDPWGMAGFHHPNRRRKLTLEEHARYLLECSDRSFQRDPEFAFVFYNIIRKMTVSSSLNFSAPLTAYQSIVQDILSLNRDDVLTLAQKFKCDPLYVPQCDKERKITKVLGAVGPVARRVPGSIGYKLCKRNEIRALINFRGAPVLFATINPSDIHNPIVSILSGRNIPSNDALLQMSNESWDWAVLAAKNPAACAKFFDLMITSYIKIILRHGKPDNGIYGECEAYYGMVEAQGRGTLHCHMLIWLAGHPPPHILKDAILTIPGYGDSVRTWINAVIHSGYIGPRASEAEDLENLRSARRNAGIVECHPGMIHIPPFDQISETAFTEEYSTYVNRLLSEYNIHRHNATCWKYLKKGEKQTPQNCRLGMNGIRICDVKIDPETAEIIPSQVHPHMASFTPVCTALLQCNYNVKFSGAGEAATSFLHYVTDYTAKPSLSMHAGLAALSYAIWRMNERIPDLNSGEKGTFLRAITIAVNSMMGQQEISHQQVMSYLVGGGDCYTNEQFQPINWGDVLKEICALRGETMDASSTPGQNSDERASVCLLPSQGNLTIANSFIDYIHRPQCEPYSGMCLYHFISCTRKEGMPTDSHGIPTKRPRHSIFSHEHPQYDTHAMVLRPRYVIPVLLGPRIALRSSVQNDNQRWARDILVLFRPWRNPIDLKRAEESWVDAYDAFSTEIPARWKAVIANMNVLAAAREAARQDRVRGNKKIFLGEMAEDIFEAGQFGYEQNAFNYLDDVEGATSKDDLVGLSSVLGVQCVSALDLCYPDQNHDPVDGWVKPITSDLASQISLGLEHMAGQKTLRATILATTTHPPSEPGDNSGLQRIRDIPPSSIACTLIDRHPFGLYPVPEGDTRRDIVDEIAYSYGLPANAEQAMAFHIVADHILGGGRQLLMYIGGPGGTGKSYVVRAIVELLSRLGRRKELLMGAPTGIAAVLIGGNTLHSLAMMNVSGRQTTAYKLQDLWRGVKYLVIDEISMVGAKFFAQFASRISMAKGEDPNSTGLLFGGINVICLGDFCQLKSPVQRPLYSYRITEKPTFEQGSANDGIDEMSGTYIWQKFDVVVYLRKNQRQSTDPLFARVLGHLGMGSCRKAENNGFRPDGMTIYDYFMQRELSRVATRDPISLEGFWDAPVVVGSKILRDRINAKLIKYHSKRLGVDHHLYCSVDKIHGRVATHEIQKSLWELPSRKTHDMLGKLPLFVGMKAIVTENVALGSGVVNGAECVVRKIVYRTDESGRRFAEAVYVQVHGSDMQIPGLETGVVLLTPSCVSVDHRTYTGGVTATKFSRKQIPIIPSYSFTDYKSQGRSMTKVIVDLVTARGQGVYVMLSRVKTLKGLLILRWFDPTKIYSNMSADLRTEMKRLEVLEEETRRIYTEWRHKGMMPTGESSTA